MADFFNSDLSRRKFIAGSVLTIGAIPIGGFSLKSEESLSVQQLIDLILKEIPGTISNTVDTIKIGNPDQVITGVVTTMFPTIEVIQKAINLKANLIIVHEPSFYNHSDETGWLEGDEVFEFKKSLLERHKIAVWRFHDYIHRHKPDGVLEGVINKLNWKRYQDDAKPSLVTLPAKQTLANIVRHVKKNLEIATLRVVASPDDECQRVLVLPGAWGGRNQINAIREMKPDLVMAGEVSEWETSEYIRDARAMGQKRSLIVLGHAQSEEPGLGWLVSWLTKKVPSIRATHIASNNPFIFL